MTIGRPFSTFGGMSRTAMSALKLDLVNSPGTLDEVGSGGSSADTGFVYDADGSRVVVITDSGDVTHYIAGIHTHHIAAGIEENTYTFGGDEVSAQGVLDAMVARRGASQGADEPVSAATLTSQRSIR